MTIRGIEEEEEKRAGKMLNQRQKPSERSARKPHPWEGFIAYTNNESVCSEKDLFMRHSRDLTNLSFSPWHTLKPSVQGSRFESFFLLRKYTHMMTTNWNHLFQSLRHSTLCHGSWIKPEDNGAERANNNNTTGKTFIWLAWIFNVAKLKGIGINFDPKA